MQVYNNRQLYWSYNVDNFITPTYFILTFLAGSIFNVGQTILWATYGFELNMNLGFRYLIVTDTFPNIFYSNLIYIGAWNTISNINSGLNLTQTYDMASLSGLLEIPLTLYSNTTFLYALNYVRINTTTRIPNSQFDLKFNLNVISTTQFVLTVSGV